MLLCVFIVVDNWLPFSVYSKVNTSSWASWNHDIVSQFPVLSGKENRRQKDKAIRLKEHWYSTGLCFGRNITTHVMVDWGTINVHHTWTGRRYSNSLFDSAVDTMLTQLSSFLMQEASCINLSCQMENFITSVSSCMLRMI